MDTDLVERILAQAKNSGRRILNEYQSKLLLRAYGIPTVEEKLALTEQEAVSAAKEFGFPVVLKAYSSKITHKTESGLVQIGINNEKEVQKGYQKIFELNGDQIEGILVQPQLTGDREFLCGLIRDELFGPAVMFGLGGIYTEALSDISFRLSPLNIHDAREMIREIRAHNLLLSFRSQQSVDEQKLVQILTSLSHLGTHYPQIKEIDINPLLVSPQGSLQAVDALVVLNGRSKKNNFPVPVDPDSISTLFYPQSIAFVGASSKMGKWGYTLMINTLSGGYQGRVYLVNPHRQWIAGQKVYPSVHDLPENVDLAVVTLPAEQVLNLFEDFETAGIKNMVLISSGFSETGKKGEQLEQELVSKAGQAGINILGPNIMGFCNTHIDLNCTGAFVPIDPGNTSMVSQSGNMGVQLLSFAYRHGIGIGIFCGSGNEAMMTVEDFLNYFAQDPTTKTLMLYIESVKNGRRFFENAAKLSKEKPVIIFKGGESKAGIEAASSHTGAMSSDSKIFAALCRQCGLVKVGSTMDLLDVSAAFSALPLPRGNKVVIMTLGGGWGVVTADLCGKYGLQVAKLPPEIISEIDNMLPYYWSRSNPIDLVGENDLSLPVDVLKKIIAWPGCDAVINLGILGRKVFMKHYSQSVQKIDPAYNHQFLQDQYQEFEDFESDYVREIAGLMSSLQKPVFGVRLVTESSDQTILEATGYKYSPVFYQTPEPAVKACAAMYKYFQFLQNQNEKGVAHEYEF